VSDDEKIISLDEARLEKAAKLVETFMSEWRELIIDSGMDEEATLGLIMYLTITRAKNKGLGAKWVIDTLDKIDRTWNRSREGQGS
jgi:hypothetical protein